MAKLKKLPKRPKKTAPLASWERWKKKAQEVKKHNDAIRAVVKKKEQISNSVKA